jgi:purine nucleoside permease
LLMSRLPVLLALLTLGPAWSAADAADPSSPSAGNAPIVVKVMIVNLFGFEAAPWLKALHAEREVRVPGLSRDYPVVHCTADGVCEVTTGMGHANAAASMMAVQLSGLFDLRRTYFLVAGIAGIDPAQGTLGSAAWARYVVDTGIAHEIDAREMPPGWQDGYFGVLTDAPGQMPQLDYRTEVFRLDESLLQKALGLSQHVVLNDSDDARKYRQHYSEAAARNPPRVIQCDTASGDTWWAGHRLGEHARSWTKLLTDGHGVYCTTQQEDNATLNALTRGAEAGLVDIRRVAVLRSGSDFDRPYPHQKVIDSMLAQRKLEGAARISAENLPLAGMPLVTDIVQHWDSWQNGVPDAATQ